MKRNQCVYQICWTLIICIFRVSSDSNLMGGDNALQQVAMASFMKQQRLQQQIGAMQFPPLSGGPPPGGLPAPTPFPPAVMPPFSGANFLTLPQLPIGVVGFPTNMSLRGPNLVPMGVGPPSPGMVSKHANLGYIAVPPGSPVNFLKTPNWTKPKSGGPDAVGLIVQGPLLPSKPIGPQADPIHHLPVNHLFVPVPVMPGSTPGPLPIGPPPPPLADILIIIDASTAMGQVEPRGQIVWNPAIVDFLNKFIHATPMGPDANRIGVVVVSKGIDDMIPMTHDKPYLVNSLNMLRPSFEGGCTEKGISTASSLFYQYGRPNAVKRIVLLTDSTLKCPYRNMAEIIYARKCGIDIIHVGFGPGPKPKLPVDNWDMSYFMVPGPENLPTIGEPVARRAFIAPIHGNWSPWSDWNMCSAAGKCSVGYQMRFRLCDNPKPKFGGQICKGFPAETRMCFAKICIDYTLGHWTRWSELTPCSSPCGVGTQTRTRTCITMDGQPSAGCKGNYVERIECVNNNCPGEGGWSFWSEWSHCSMTCGAGVKVRARQCDNPLPSNDGKSCQGPPLEEAVCDTGTPCPIHGGLGPWEYIGVCEGACGVGTQKRVRACDSPLPQFGGNPCVGELLMFEPCETGVQCVQHGHWGPWSEYLPCSVSCGVGIKQRKRLCDNPPPKSGGLFCDGPHIEELECHTDVPCPVHGHWSPWSDFKPCSVECGIGFTQRIRMCNSPAPMYGGLECLGAPIEERECNTNIECSVNGGWGPWTDFGVCSVECGVGIATRTRLCNNPVPMYGGAMCVGLALEQRECATGILCPVNGFWSHWLPWGQCSAACAVGTRQRHRLCNNPLPDFGGLSCDGPPLQEEPCDTGIPCPVDGGWSPWSEPLHCSASCGVGTSKRIRSCSNPTPIYGGAGCFGPDFEVLECNSGIPCPIKGGWSIWTHWSICDAKCGLSSQHRNRICDSPPPAFGGPLCNGNHVEERECDTGMPCPVPGGWSLWTEWATCSVHCGVGISIRKRFCDAPPPQFGGPSCIGPDLEEMKCDSGVPCPIDGGWSMWGELSSCSASCGVGIMRRSRVCNSPAPMFGGVQCLGYDFEEIPCDTQVECPVHGHWGLWSDYTVCSVKCGLGVMVRKRQCDAPAPLFGGLPCAGLAIDEAPCDTGIFCPINGGWTLWSEYTPCNVNCGVGIIKRVRECTNPRPQYGGLPCEGFAFEETVCDTGLSCRIDGNWGHWTEFTHCDVSCGIGLQRRTRLCDNPPPMHGGGFCPGPPLEPRECDSGVPCPIPGGWTPWTDYGLCNAKCGIGIKTRIRECTNPAPLYGGEMCFGPTIEESPCDTGVFCPMDGDWTPWSSWTVCSADCGSGLSQRKRECADPSPMYGGLPCQGPAVEEKVCDTGVHCRVHGGWSPWGEFMPCSVQCGVGVTQRNRVCNNPLPMYGGDYCIGEETQGKPCETGVYCPVDGGFSIWTEWSLCMGECGEGIQFRERFCNFPEPMYGGAPCKGLFREERGCDTGQFCPISGGWGEWSMFTTCSEPCGQGVRERSRFCDSPVPMYGGQICVGADVDTQTCETGIMCPLHGEWSLWSIWSDCSASCLNGIQFRERTCTNPPPDFGGLPCKGIARQEQVCNTGVPCPVNGGWGFWTDWLPCSAVCGTGVLTRSRACNSPPPQFGGMPCSGPDVEETMCDSGIPCPVNGYWTPWASWSLCTASCGLGLKSRVRECSNPAPMYGGKMCLGEREQALECDAGIVCPTDGFWSPWSTWTPCSKPCGVGLQGRARTCTNPPPSDGGIYCKGSPSEKVPCDTGIPCMIDGDWGMWTPFSKCDVHCGTGFQIRTRICDNPPPQFGGMKCIGPPADKMICDTGVACPVDGGWTLWTQFGPCQGVCGIGSQERIRTCENPIPQFGGMSCMGPHADVRECDTGVLCAVHGGWSPWYQWSACLADCGVGVRERRRECDNPKPMFDGMPCEGPQTESSTCETGIHCPIHGSWSPWSPPTSCSVSCGAGVQSRIRTCNEPLPQYGGAMCIGPAEEIIECDMGVACPIHGNWGPWTNFGLCNVKCGVGIHMRERICDHPVPQFGGFPCAGPNLEEAKCDTGTPCAPQGWSLWSPWSGCKASCGMSEQIRVRQCFLENPADKVLLCHGPDAETRPCDTGVHCPVHGGWTLWTHWDVCGVPCGAGVHNRYRECTAPVPAFGGNPCIGPAVEEKECLADVPCPIDGGWTLWTLWTGCSAECGMGVRSRERFCDNPPAQFGGIPCMGLHTESEKCSTGVPCPVHGQWSPWTPWSDCSKMCGVGSQIKNRYCNSPAPQFGGMDCPGPSEEVQDCVTGIPCPIDGHWGQWMHWSNCATCGISEQRRARLCDSPMPQFGGLQCKGFAEQSKMCDAGVPCPIDGHWGPWSEFGICSVSCEMGLQVRTRMCDNPPPQFGGIPCVGPNEEANGCDTEIHCPVHGNWGPWYGWSSCVGNCGMGKRERRRECDNPKPLYDGIPCYGPQLEIGKCDTYIPCAKDGNWGEWSQFTKCSAKCDIGIQERFRECNNPPPVGDGLFCPGPATEVIDCDSGIPCRVDGKWGLWGKWGVCMGECGEGVQTRERMCDSPFPQNGGALCDGLPFEQRTCDTMIPCVIPAGWTPWSPWSKCTASCAMGIVTRFRECTSPSPGIGHVSCEGPSIETMDCDSGVPCSIHGNWSPWYSWSSCSVACGIGIRERRRECDNPLPQYGGLPCEGKYSDVQDCDTGVHCPIHGGWTLWAPWTMCSHSCGIGMKRRSRLCENPLPEFGGLSCEGPMEEQVECDSGRFCPVDGHWSHWTEFTPCKAPCGFGEQKRFRSCSEPPPQYGGLDCVGLDAEAIKCDTGMPCQVDGGWTLWSDWTMCAAKCGLGTSERIRKCTNPAPMFGGLPCQGTGFEIIECHSGVPCPVDGHWSPWSQWDLCSAACGIGRKVRYRTCDNPRPEYNGQLCKGLPEEVLDCDTGLHCPVHGNWAHWSEWGICDGCGVGNQIRFRTCSNPRAMYGGDLCVGAPEENRGCESGIPCPIHGNWAMWSDWGMCDASCGDGTQVRVRTCSNPRPQFGGELCFGIPEEAKPCSSGIPCPVDGNWGGWLAWEQCSAMCGKGRRKRVRLCDSPAPAFGGLICTGFDMQEDGCDTGIPCVTPPGWSLWGFWGKCSVSCGVGIQLRHRLCNSPPPSSPGIGCDGIAEDSRPCDTFIPCAINGGWTEWSPFGKCIADCSMGAANTVGFTVRKRFCENPPPSVGGLPCAGNAVEKMPCNDYPPCFVAEWSQWTRWSRCSETCGPGQQERTRYCIHSGASIPTDKCQGLTWEKMPCEEVVCPLYPLNCSAECKWDNGIGYATYPGDCSKFVQCETLDGVPRVHDCSWGLLWSLDLLQCVFTIQSECDICKDHPGQLRPYHISCRAFWDCTGAVPQAGCCGDNERFNSFTNQCELDVKGICNEPCNKDLSTTTVVDEACLFRTSPKGMGFYEQQIGGVWMTRPCSKGTVFSEIDCQCIYFTDGFNGVAPECVPDLQVTFDSLQSDLDQNPGLHVENVRYIGDGTAYFDGTAAINDNTFANSEWGKDVYVYIRFKPEGKSHMQGLVHNSGCGPSDIGPSVFIGLDRAGPDTLSLKFAAVPQKKHVEYNFVNISTPANQMIDAWFKYSAGEFEAEVNGQTVRLSIPGRGIGVARRHGALNIGGNLCKIGDVAFGGLEGYFDEVRVYKCKPKGHFDHNVPKTNLVSMPTLHRPKQALNNRHKLLLQGPKPLH